jgi:hypothetical protein
MYWFKFLVFSRFIKNILKKINNKYLIVSQQKIIKNRILKKKLNFLIYKRVRKKFMSEILYNNLKKNKNNVILMRELINDLYKKLNLNFEDNIKKMDVMGVNTKKKYLKIKSIFKKYPNYNIAVPS